MSGFINAQNLIREFKGDAYIYGTRILSGVGPATAKLGKRTVIIRNVFPGSNIFVLSIKESLLKAGLLLLAEFDGAAPNAPREDLERIANILREMQPEVVVSFGGGSTIDATKAAIVLSSLFGDVEDYFGTDLVTQGISESGKNLTPHVAIQTAASSAAHLTKYSNITDLSTGQKKLIVDNAIVPNQPIFDYEVTYGAPRSLTADGALDGISHSLEVLFGAVGKPEYPKIESVATESISLVVNHLPRVMADLQDAEAREALGLATDLGGYAIMLGGTNGAHLTSFSFVDILSHGRACALMNPYYTVFFAPAVEDALKVVGNIFRAGGFTSADMDKMHGRDLGLAVAEAMLAFEEIIGLPTRLSDVPGFNDRHIERALEAAKNPQLRMKLENMPISLTTDMVDDYMGSVLYAARDGDLSIIKNV